jgi:AcrR family transcriptional regulator
MFLEHGFTVTTSAIARAAGVSEGSIFKRFPTKTSLFEAALCTDTFDFSEILKLHDGDGDPQGRLMDLGLHLVEFFRTILPRSLMLWANSSINPIQIMKGSPDPPPLKLLRYVAEFLRRAQTLETMGTFDTKVTATILIGAFRGLVFLEILQDKTHSPDETRTYVKGVIRTLWNGIKAE